MPPYPFMWPHVQMIFGTQAAEHLVASVSRALAETWLTLRAHMHSDIHIRTCIYVHTVNWHFCQVSVGSSSTFSGCAVG